ncbi:MAG TPA: hypothetical protein VHU87_00090 [Rhizomicrobium sp.]|jgi:tetratricopeptide (TPR) repeat protein|nr:hypothetical protein [Rhizomicrobium sp.]
MAEDAPSTGGGEKTAGDRSAAAPALALASASREKADRFLDKQGALADLQIENLRLANENLLKQDEFELSHLRFRRFSDYARFALEIAAGLVVLLIVSALGAMVWSATQDRDLVVEAFSVPQDVAQTGMTGTVLAGRVLDKFGQMQASTFSLTQGAGSYRSTDAEQVRVEIPDTGISIGELNRYLREWLGHETHVAGDLVHTPKGLTLSVRYGDAPGAVAEGGDLDALIAKAAERIYAAARPLRYADYLGAHGRTAEAEAIIVPLAARGSAQERALAYLGWSALGNFDGDQYGALEKSSLAARLDPANAAAWYEVETAAFNLGHNEQALVAEDTVLSLLKQGKATDLNPDMAAALPVVLIADSDIDKGDPQGAAAACQSLGNLDMIVDCDSANLAQFAAVAHDLAEARRLAALIPAKHSDGRQSAEPATTLESIAEAAQDWPGALRQAKQADAILAGRPNRFWDRSRGVWPVLAYDMARNGDVAGAEALIARTAGDCDLCVRMRAEIAAAKHDWAAAARWFAIVSARTPSIPYADTEWGEMLLHQGKFDAAIAKFESANRKGPHFADPLEMWGEALMEENRSDLALAKFADADKYAPNWGRLHLKWGEALGYAGRKAEAQKQFAIAAGLDHD